MKLEVGMVIYQESGFSSDWLTRFVIDRVTATQAIAGEGGRLRFDRDVREHHGFSTRGSKGYGRTLYHIATPEFDALYRKQRLLAQINKIKFKDLNEDQLRAVIEITLSAVEKPEPKNLLALQLQEIMSSDLEGETK